MKQHIIKSVLKKLSSSSLIALGRAKIIQNKLSQLELTVEMLLLGLYEVKENSPTHCLMDAFGINRDRLWKELAQYKRWNGAFNKNNSFKISNKDLIETGYSANMTILFNKVLQLANEKKLKIIKTRHLLAALLDNSESTTCQLLKNMGIPVNMVQQIVQKLSKKAMVTPGTFSIAANMAHSDAGANVP